MEDVKKLIDYRFDAVAFCTVDSVKFDFHEQRGCDSPIVSILIFAVIRHRPLWLGCSIAVRTENKESRLQVRTRKRTSVAQLELPRSRSNLAPLIGTNDQIRTEKSIQLWHFWETH